MSRFFSFALAIAFVAVVLLAPALAYDNGLGATPPMGWNTWCTDDVCGLIDKCSDALVRQQALAMVQYGMPKLGYEFVNMDDCWSAESRDGNGDLQPDPARFPFGMKALADYVHSLGLKIGLYTCVGTKTCRLNRPGSFGNYERDAATLASWGIDFVKADNCFRPGGYTEVELYTNFSRALNATGRPILFSLCEWGDEDVQSWGATLGQMYRIQMDHLPLWDLPTHAAGKGFGQGTLQIIEYVATLKPSTFVKQFGWMDPDFLMTLFWPTMTATYSRSEFSFWSLWSAPLIVATQISNMTQEKMSILMNDEVIAIDRDPLATAGNRVFNNSNGGQVWSKPLANGDTAVLFFNSNLFIPANITLNWSQVGIGLGTATVTARDLWAKKDVGTLPATFSTVVDPADVLFLRVRAPLL